MKKIILFSLFIASVMTACYDDYTSDYEYTAAYFSYQYPARTVILDEAANNLEIKVGVAYGGRYSYEGFTETVNFVIADTLITNNSSIQDKGIKVMPSSWYTLSDNSQIAMENSNVGFLTVSIKQDSLASHPDASMNTYAIPFALTSASTDSILGGKDFSIVVVKFKNQLDGRYYVKGVDNELNTDGTVASSLVYSNPALVLNKFIFLNTTSMDGLTVPRIGSNENANEFIYNMTVRIADGSALLSAEPTSKIKELVGAAQYSFEDRTFICNYNYKMDGIEHSVVDTLIYANTEIEMESWN